MTEEVDPIGLSQWLNARGAVQNGERNAGKPAESMPKTHRQ